MADAPLVLVVDGTEVCPVELADTALARAKGLLGRASVHGALVLDPARSVHTFGMRFAIDVAFVDETGIVVDTVTMGRWRIGLVRRQSKAVIEARAGSFAQWYLAPGSVVDWAKAESANTTRVA